VGDKGFLISSAYEAEDEEVESHASMSGGERFRGFGLLEEIGLVEGAEGLCAAEFDGLSGSGSSPVFFEGGIDDQS